ncbi:hypothetical protein PsYK624_173220 [Phanerochaete sordida]|uniref:Uncharacterized protein n=1 Tax=Phanerochaete sordida TaxID=48140 RepID=A0A9P3GSD4_9APHY|nr:hypothetical protein PsYK624_173220 [Phanerochaete sordida]
MQTTTLAASTGSSSSSRSSSSPTSPSRRAPTVTSPMNRTYMSSFPSSCREPLGLGQVNVRT